jgi:hypothetical protein
MRAKAPVKSIKVVAPKPIKHHRLQKFRKSQNQFTFPLQRHNILNVENLGIMARPPPAYHRVSAAAAGDAAVPAKIPTNKKISTMCH